MDYSSLRSVVALMLSFASLDFLTLNRTPQSDDSILKRIVSTLSRGLFLNP